ncbi:MAG TPA: hypothetical protein VF657_07415 [Actinoplanes sp.]|jgi:LPXTG-motif cell wall-anchored protein
MPRSLHRLLAGSAALLTTLAVPALPAYAAEGGVEVSLHFPDVAVVVGGEAKSNALLGWLAPGGAAAEDTRVAGIRLSVDTADVADFATVVIEDDPEIGPDASCDTAGTALTCTLTGPFDIDPEPGMMALAALRVTAKPGATPGASGELTLTAQADDGPVSTYRSAVAIGEEVDLAAVQPKPVTVAAGERATADLRVRNAGPRPVTGSVLLLAGWSERLRDGAGFRNCTYGMLTVCAFDDVLAPGATYALSDPIALRMPVDAAVGSSAASFGVWYTTAEWAEVLATLPDDIVLGPPGTGGETRLESLASAAAAPQVDTNPDNNYLFSEITVGGDRRTDMAAIGATVSGSAGDQVKARVGFVNNGPGTLYHRDFPNTDPATHVTLPAGLRAVQVDDACLPLEWLEDEEPADVGDDGTAGFPEYLCYADAEQTGTGGRLLFDFTFEVGQDEDAAAGRVVINETDLVAGPTIDRNRRNDSAKILVDITGEDGDNGGSGGSDGSGGGLPITGAPTGVVATIGGLLLLVGSAGILLVRRRRIRFTA